jgi:two-component system phosphate regulon response regulator PhoB
MMATSDVMPAPVATERILLVDDEPDLRQLVTFNLREAGFEVDAVGSGQAGLALAAKIRPAVIVLDLMLPDVSGMEVCRALRADPQLADVAVLMLTARGDEYDRVLGFEVGADDYVVKPFSVRELLLRVNAVLRRKDAPTTDFVEFGELRIDPAAHRAWVAGAEVALTTLEFRLLLTLYERKNRVQSRSVLLNDIWGIEADITTRTVDTHVKRLREKMKGIGRYIETVRGVGYRFTEHPSEDGTTDDL